MKLYERLTRRKKEDEQGNSDSQLARVLGTFDLVALGVGSTLGVGIYVVAGGVAKQLAGPAVVISFFLAAVVTAFAGMSYAEFGARVPKAGSAYIYSYYCVGEFAAFIIGWTLILEYAIGAASVAKGISSYVDSLTNFTVKDAFTDVAPLHASFLSSYVDFFAMSLCLLLATCLAIGVKESSIINTVFTSINVGVVLFFIVSGLSEGDPHNWDISKSEIPVGVDGGDGGFAPFGISGIIHGAAICFYGFVGFDSIATTGEEVRNPQKAIPQSIVISLVVILGAYLGVSATLTLMVPYYLQDVDAPMPYAYDYVEWPAAKWVVGTGALFGLFASLFGALFPLPRIIYSMANDGLLYRCLGQVNSKYHTPLVGIIVSGILTSLLAAVFNLQQLVGLNAIGTLLTYTLVSICVVVLRYQESENDVTQLNSSETSCLISQRNTVSCKQIFRQFYTFRRCPTPTPLTSTLVTTLLCAYCILSVFLSLSIQYLGNDAYYGDPSATIVLVVLSVLLLLVMVSMAVQPSSSQRLSFQMPLVPYIPCISIFCNIYLMVVLDGHTWIRFAIVMLIGFFIYFTYGIRNSSENNLEGTERKIAGLKSNYKEIDTVY